MTTDSLVSEQTHQYFLQEAAELLQTMDDELENLRVDFSVQKVHNLMRAAHTLKGAAASVGLDNIKSTTHSLEDVFKALCHQDAVISVEMEGLIFGAYECLQLLLSTQLADAQVDETYLLDRMAGIVSQLQEMLGDRFGQDGQLPSSSELGFDMTQSIFEVGVTQRLDALAVALDQSDADALFSLLENHAEVFIGLAESFELPGFGDIALTTLAALEKSPTRVLEIASVALENYRQAQALVLAGDRDQGGAPSPELLALLEASVDDVIQSVLFPIDASMDALPEGSLPSIDGLIDALSEDGLPPIDAPLDALSEDSLPLIDAPIDTLLEDGLPPIDGLIDALSEGSFPSIDGSIDALSEDGLPPIDAPIDALSEDGLPIIDAPIDALPEGSFPSIDAPTDVLSEDGLPSIDAPTDALSEDGLPPTENGLSPIDAPIGALPEDSLLPIDYEIIEGYPEIASGEELLDEDSLDENLLAKKTLEEVSDKECLDWPLALVEPPSASQHESRQRQQSFTDAYVELANARWPESLWNLLTRPIGAEREPMRSSARVSRLNKSTETLDPDLDLETASDYRPNPRDFIQYTVDYPVVSAEASLANDDVDSETSVVEQHDTLIQHPFPVPSEFIDDTLNDFNGELDSGFDVDTDAPDISMFESQNSVDSLEGHSSELSSRAWVDDTLIQLDTEVDIALESSSDFGEITPGASTYDESTYDESTYDENAYDENAYDENAYAESQPQEQFIELSELAELTPAGLETLTSLPELENSDTLAPVENDLADGAGAAADTMDAVEDHSDGDEIADFLNDIALAPLALPLLEIVSEPEAIAPPLNPEPVKAESVKPRSVKSTPKASVRMTVEHLDRLSQSMGELLTHQNQQALHIDQLSMLSKQLLSRIDKQQALLNTYKENGINSSSHLSQHSLTSSWQTAPLLYDQFDALELDEYSDTQLLAQRLLSETVQQAEVSEAIDLFLRRSQQTIDKQTRLLANTRETLLEARMLPMDKVFQRFPSALARLERQHNKPVSLVIEGGDVLVDKSIADKLFDPLLHLVRNAFDHGVEQPEVRRQQNKSATGTITLSARQQGRYLVIEVKDDGKGIDLATVRQKAIENNLITASVAASLTPMQTADLLFAPGFSTASVVDDLSGRGVGLDAVKAQVRSLQGLVTVRHEPNAGTCFTLQIPASLTIAKLLICQAQGQTYALVADAIEHILLPTPDQVSAWNGGKTLTWQHNQQTHLIRVNTLADALHYAAPVAQRFSSASENNISALAAAPILVLRHDGSLTGGSFIGLEVDQLLGEQELVINSLGEAITPPDYIYGSSILPDGQLTLVLDGLILARSMLARPSGANAQQEMPGKIEISFAEENLVPGSANRKNPGALQRDALGGALVLTIDDSITVRNSLAETLEKAGYRVIQARDGAEALQRLQQYSSVSAIVCDIEMPGMNGFEFLKAKRGRAEIAAIPVIMLSSRGGAKHRFLTKELGAIAHLTKPYLAPELLKTVTSAVEQNLRKVLSPETLNPETLNPETFNPETLNQKTLITVGTHHE